MRFYFFSTSRWPKWTENKNDSFEDETSETNTANFNDEKSFFWSVAIWNRLDFAIDK